MSTPDLTLGDLTSFTAQIRGEAERMKRTSSRQRNIYLGIGLGLAIYFAWAMNRIIAYIEPANLAEALGDITVGQAHELLNQVEEAGRTKAPELVQAAETAVIDSVPDFRLQLQTELHEGLTRFIKESLGPGDHLMVEELAKSPAAIKLLATAGKNPDDAARLFAEVQKGMLAHPDVKAGLDQVGGDLAKLRNTLKKLEENRGLTPAEQATRRLLQVVVAQVELPAPAGTPAPAKKPQ